jgi:hypothetical protein
MPKTTPSEVATAIKIMFGLAANDLLGLSYFGFDLVGRDSGSHEEVASARSAI